MTVRVKVNIQCCSLWAIMRATLWARIFLMTRNGTFGPIMLKH